MRRSQDLDVLDPVSTKQLSRSGLVYAVPVAATIVVADQASKQWAVSNLNAVSCSVEDACIDLVGGARFQLTFNTGAAFQSGESLGPIIGLLAIVVSVVLLFMAHRRTDRLGATLLGGIAGGAIGNLLDRLFRSDNGFLSGGVVDFIRLGNWYPWIFNVADAALVCSVLVIIGYSLLHPETNTVATAAPKKTPKNTSDDGADD